MDRLTSSKLKIFSVKNSIKRIKRKAAECEKIFANYIPTKGLVSNIHKEL